MNCSIPIRALSVLAALGVVSAGDALAQSATGQPAGYQVAQQSYANVITQLQSGGYQIVEVRSTFLGRIRILARNKVHLREVIVSRSTGEVKRDVIVQILAGATGGNSQSSGSGSSGSGSSAGSGSSGSSGSGSGIDAGASVGGGGGINAGVSAGGGGFSADVSVGGGGFGAGIGK